MFIQIFFYFIQTNLDNKMSNIEIKQLNHRGKSQIGIYFKYDEGLINIAKKIGCTFSSTHRCWIKPQKRRRWEMPIVIVYLFNVQTKGKPLAEKQAKNCLIEKSSYICNLKTKKTACLTNYIIIVILALKRAENDMYIKYLIPFE